MSVSPFSDDYLVALDPLFQADTELGQRLLTALAAAGDLWLPELVEDLGRVGATAWEKSPDFGRALVVGCEVLLPLADAGLMREYLAAVGRAGRITPVLGKLAAERFVPVLGCRAAGLTVAFKALFAELGPWGPYPLGQVCNGVELALELAGAESGLVFVEMVVAALGQKIEEKKLIRLLDRLAAGIRAMADDKRPWQLAALGRVVALDYGLAPAYLRGLDKGLRFLKEKDLDTFVAAALGGGDEGERRARFLGLEAIAARDLFRELQTMAPLRAQIPELQRYLQARGGRALAVRPLSDLPVSPLQYPAGPCCDGRRIFLPGEMEAGRDVAENQRFLRLLAGWELALVEAGSFDFDLGRWRRRRACENEAPGLAPAAFPHSDYYAFFASYARPKLAEKLFNLAEYARLRFFLEKLYPGFARRVREINRHGLAAPDSPAMALVRALYLGLMGLAAETEIKAGLAAAELGFLDQLARPASGLNSSAGEQVFPGVEAAADWTDAVYDLVASRPELAAALLDFTIPFGRCLRFDLVYLARAEAEKKAHDWRRALAEQGLDADKSALRKIAEREEQEGLKLTPELLRRLLEQSGAVFDKQAQKVKRLPRDLDLSRLLPPPAEPADNAVDLGEPVPTFYYDEWDYRLNDYLRNHVKLLEHRKSGHDEEFYAEALSEHGGLIRRIRRNFELIRPETMQILRHWPEGDAFDYDALLEYALDRRLRRTPSDRLYRKRLKVERDVAVFVLVDLSSSTRKEVADGGGKSILAVEKEALVLFCEALERVGDHYALAGFSGSGRLAAEFFYLKDFDEPLDHEVKGRIGGLRPEKNTRMGPALRHAAKALKNFPARVKLMIILSDGLPNDQDYSGEYAIADSRSAIRESRSAFIHVHAITVNAVNSPHLDNLYGDVHHTVIADVRRLPDKLPRIYRALTRQ